MLARLEMAPGLVLLEIGCGDGNFFPVYAPVLGPGGRLIGLDVNSALLDQALAKARLLGIRAEGIVWDFDSHPYPLSDSEVDYVIAPFSAYYSRDITAWLNDCLRVLKPGGTMLLIGPASGNAPELYDLNLAVTGIRTIAETEETSTKLEAGFLPELRRRQDVKVESTLVSRELVFPDAEEFARYYLATWLYEKTAEKIAKRISFDDVVKAAASANLRLTKSVICIEAKKRS